MVDMKSVTLQSDIELTTTTLIVTPTSLFQTPFREATKSEDYHIAQRIDFGFRQHPQMEGQVLTLHILLSQLFPHV